MNSIYLNKLNLISDDGGDNRIYAIDKFDEGYVLHESYSYIWEIDNYYYLDAANVSRFLPLKKKMSYEFWEHIKNLKIENSLKQIKISGL